jgi:hypothetical protein
MRIEPGAEPELVQNGIDLVSRLLTRSPSAFINLEPSDAVEFFFLFTLQVMDGKEPLPKAAAAEFWVRIAFFFCLCIFHTSICDQGI